MTNDQFQAKVAEEKAITEAAAAKGLEIFFTANTGYVRGSSWDIVITVFGNTYPVKETLKAHGAIWSGRAKCWVFSSKEAFQTALAEI